MESPLLEMGLARGHLPAPPPQGNWNPDNTEIAPWRLAQLRGVHQGPGPPGELVGTSGYSLL